jgi:hypothetical protein
MAFVEAVGEPDHAAVFSLRPDILKIWQDLNGTINAGIWSSAARSLRTARAAAPATRRRP